MVTILMNLVKRESSKSSRLVLTSGGSTGYLHCISAAVNPTVPLVRIYRKPNQRRWASVARPGSSVAGTQRTAEANLMIEVLSQAQGGHGDTSLAPIPYDLIVPPSGSGTNPVEDDCGGTSARRHGLRSRCSRGTMLIDRV